MKYWIGLFAGMDKAMLEEGVDTIVKIARGLLASSEAGLQKTLVIGGWMMMKTRLKLRGSTCASCMWNEDRAEVDRFSAWTILRKLPLC